MVGWPQNYARRMSLDLCNSVVVAPYCKNQCYFEGVDHVVVVERKLVVARKMMVENVEFVGLE
jgi:hypothetical protein